MSAPPPGDPLRHTTIAHGALVVLNPLPADALDRALDALSLPAEPAILDLGCGKGALLADAVARLGGRGLGLDRNPSYVAAGRGLIAARGLAAQVALEVAEVSPELLAQDAFAGVRGAATGWDLVLCVGARPLGATFEANLAGLAALLRPGGALILGEGYWRRAPEPAYLAVLGAAPEEMPTRAALAHAGESLGLRVRCIIESPEETFDGYENAYFENTVAFAALHPDDPEAEVFAAAAHAWKEAYRRWGRETLGFALMAFDQGATA